MSEGPPRRKWLQVHLSTAVLLMLAAGGLIWMNVTGRHSELEWMSHSLYNRIEIEKYGWPYTVVRWITEVSGTYKNRYSSGFSALCCAIDLAVALAILFAVWFVCERWIAWRAGRKKG